MCENRTFMLLILESSLAKGTQNTSAEKALVSAILVI